MKFEPDLGNLILPAGISVISLMVLFCFRKLDEEMGSCCVFKLWKSWLLYSVLVGIGLNLAQKQSGYNNDIGLLLLGIYLVICTVTDALICQVYDVMQYIGVIGGGLWLFLQVPGCRLGGSLILFAFIQYFVFGRMYGKGDAMGYCICSLYLTGKQMGLEGYLYHMFISFCLLVFIQIIRKNISRKGNLKEPVALYPYITTGFLVIWVSAGA